MKVYYNKKALAMRYSIIVIAICGFADSVYKYLNYNDSVEFWFAAMFAVVTPFVIYNVVINTILPIAELTDRELLVIRWPFRPKVCIISECIVEDKGWGIQITDKNNKKYTFFKFEIRTAEYDSIRQRVSINRVPPN